MNLAELDHLKQIFQRQQLIVDNIPAMIAYWDKNQRCQFANRAYIEWFGVAPEMLIGKSMIELLGPELHARNKVYIEGALGGIVQNFERDLIYRSTGQVKHTKATYIPEIIDSEVKGFFVLVTDVTELKEAQLTAEREREKAQRASLLKSRFLANMSHEIRTPMNGVLGLMELLRDTDLTDEQVEFVNAAILSAEHLLTVINDILDISKVEAGELVLHPSIFDLQEQLKAALGAYIINAKEKGLSVDLIYDQNLPRWLIGDSVRLRQVIVNLFGNALKFTNSGSIVLEVSKSNIPDEVNFSISDTGPGIANESIDLIFKPFQQGSEGDARSFGGTGLGLSISRELVTLMGGKIVV